MGDKVYLYHGGYAPGHKVNRFEERQIGLVAMQRDRYVARVAGNESGRLTTPLALLNGERLTLNVDSRGGEVRVGLLDENRAPVPGFTPEDAEPIALDSLAARVVWRKPLRTLKGTPVRLSFHLKRARLYAFALD